MAHGTGYATIEAGLRTLVHHRRLRLTARISSAIRWMGDGGKVDGRACARRSTRPLFLVHSAGARLERRRLSRVANAGAEPPTRSSQASEFGLVEGGQKPRRQLVFITDVNALGWRRRRHVLTTAFLLDMNDETRSGPAGSWRRKAEWTMRRPRLFRRFDALPESGAGGVAPTRANAVIEEDARHPGPRLLRLKRPKIREDGRDVHDMYRGSENRRRNRKARGLTKDQEPRSREKPSAVSARAAAVEKSRRGIALRAS